jgi:hypothetical protein
MDVIKGVTNEKLLELTNMIAGQPVEFNADADKTTEADVKSAEESARAYALARNRGASPRSLTGLDAGLVASVRDWCKSKGQKMRGTSK